MHRGRELQDHDGREHRGHRDSRRDMHMPMTTSAPQPLTSTPHGCMATWRLQPLSVVMVFFSSSALMSTVFGSVARAPARCLVAARASVRCTVVSVTSVTSHASCPPPAFKLASAPYTTPTFLSWTWSSSSAPQSVGPRHGQPTAPTTQASARLLPPHPPS
eukprot:116644-Pyramimonas_sp.AAC.1